MVDLETLLWRFPSGMMGWRNLRRNRVRTALAAAGIVIGVIAIASLGMAGAAIQYNTQSNLGDLTNRITVRAGPDSPHVGLTETQVREIRSVTVNATVIPEKTTVTRLSAHGRDARVSVTAVENPAPLYTAARGTVPERLQAGALVSGTVADDLGLEVGDPVKYHGHLYRIRAILDSNAQGLPGQGSGSLVLPLSALVDQPYSSVTVVTTDGDAAVALANQIETRINGERAAERDHELVSATTLAGLRERIGSLMDTLNLALLGIGSIGLLVAGVAILNIMLMSTIERRGEIGVLRAVGIRRFEVLRMILTEAGLLGLLGGGLGALCSLAIGLALNAVLFGDATLALRWPSLTYVLYGSAFGVGASLVSGLYPAWKAANDPPVEALR